MIKHFRNNILGRHLLVEFYNCDKDTLNNVNLIEKLMNEAAVGCGATVVQSSFHRFQPYGVSGVVVIAESHLAVHTWPEYCYASVDLFTCGNSVDPMVAYTMLKSSFDAKYSEIQELKRGNLDVIQHKINTDKRHVALVNHRGGIGK